MIKIRNVFALFILLPFVSLSVSAASLYTTGGSFTNEVNSGLTLGFLFSPNENISATALGVWDGGADGAGLESSHDIGLWDSVGTLIASTTVVGSDNLDGGFRYSSIAPIVLTSGEQYTVAAYFSGTGDKVFSNNGVSFDPLITVLSDTLFDFGSGLANPANADSSWRTAVNVQFTTVSNVPIPAAVWLFGTALLGLVGVKRKK